MSENTAVMLNTLIFYLILILLCLTPLSAIFQSVLLVEETVPEKITDKLYHTMLYKVHLAMNRVQT